MQTRSKVWVIGDGTRRPLIEERLFERQTVSGVDRLAVSTDNDWCTLMLELVAPLGANYSCLYERSDEEQDARFESSPMGMPELSHIVETYRDFLELDPRHNFWVYNHETTVQVILDEHNHLFVYGHLDAAVELLRDKGFQEGKVELPTPHVHLFTESGTADESALIARLESDRHP